MSMWQKPLQYCKVISLQLIKINGKKKKKTDWFVLLAVQGTIRNLLKQHISKVSIIPPSAFFMVQFSQPYVATGKIIPLTIWAFVGRVMSLLFNTLSSFVVGFLPRSSHLLIPWLHSSSTVIWSPRRGNLSLLPPSPFYLPCCNGARCYDLSCFNI